MTPNCPQNDNMSSSEESDEQFNEESCEPESQIMVGKKKLTLKPNLTKNQIKLTKTLIRNPFKKLKGLPHVPRLEIPKMSGKATIAKLRSIQEYILSFQYNFLDEFFFNTNKYRPLYKIMDTCREMTRDALPIRCLEGSFLSIYLTQDLEDLKRFPIIFRSHVGSTSYKHIVIAVFNGEKWGSLGMSRNSSLMYKPMKYRSLSSLLKNFEKSYQKAGHRLLNVNVGLPIPHYSYSKEPLCWEFLSLRVSKGWKNLQPLLKEFVLDSEKLSLEYTRNCQISIKYRRKYYGHLSRKLRLAPLSSIEISKIKENRKKEEKNDTMENMKESSRSSCSDSSSSSVASMQSDKSSKMTHDLPIETEDPISDVPYNPVEKIDWNE